MTLLRLYLFPSALTLSFTLMTFFLSIPYPSSQHLRASPIPLSPFSYTPLSLPLLLLLYLPLLPRLLSPLHPSFWRLQMRAFRSKIFSSQSSTEHKSRMAGNARFVQRRMKRWVIRSSALQTYGSRASSISSSFLTLVSIVVVVSVIVDRRFSLH